MVLARIVGTGPNGPGRIHGGSSGNEKWLGRCVSLTSNGNRPAAGTPNISSSARIEIWDLISVHGLKVSL